MLSGRSFMVKKIFTSGLFLVWISSLALAGYRLFEPKAAQSIEDNKVSVASVDAQGNSIENQDPKVALTDEESQEESVYHYYYFCTPENTDCMYVQEYVLKPLAAILEVEQISILEYIDISTLSVEWTPQRLKNQWGFDNFPAFVTTETLEDGSRAILSVLSWNAEDPIDQNDLKNWMIKNQIWTGPVEEEQGIPIEKPQE